MDIANRLIASVEQGFSIAGMSDSFKSFMRDGRGISVPRGRAEQYLAALQQLFELDRDVETTYTLSTFETEVIALIIPHVYNKTAVEDREVRAFLEKLKTAPVANRDVFRPIFGVKISGATTPVVRGPYTIYDTDAHASQLATDMVGDVFFGEVPPHLIKVSVRARENKRAIELADELFERFETTIRYMIGHHTTKFDVGIVNYRGARLNSVFMQIEGGAASVSHNREGVTELIPIDDPYFINHDMGFDRIWGCLASNSNTELEKRLLLAVDWVGQSIAENAPASAFLKAAIALEILFTYSEKSLINASILSQISENTALLLGDDVKSRQDLEAEVKRLYSMRSSIAHAGKSDVELADVDAIRFAARNVIAKIFTAPAMTKISSVSEMYKLFKSMKYSCSAF